MFVVGKERRAWWPVKWTGAAEDGGALIDHQIEMQFRLLDVDQFAAFERRTDEVDKQLEADAAGERSKSAAYAELIMDIATNWRGVGGENGEPLTWSEENLRLLMGVAGLAQIVVATFTDCLRGRAKAREGN